MLLALPLFETALSILRRFMRHTPIFRGDREHIHHRLIDYGFSMRGAVLVLYATFSLAAAFSLLASSSRGQYAGLVVVAFCLFYSAVIWTSLDRLGYIELREAAKMILRGAFSRRMIYTRVCLWEFQHALAKASSLEGCWAAIIRAARTLGFYSVEMRVGGEQFRSLSEGVERLHDCWSVSIPLSDRDYIRLGREFDSHAQEFVMTYFIASLRDLMRDKITDLRGPREQAEVPTGEKEFGSLAL
jgi:UDP-GlcNAc:undecaprenyl-phosphate GlcNAc-1-phosphate transferase